VRRFTKKRGGEIDGEKYFNERSSKKGNKYEKTLILDVRNTDAFDDWKIEGGQVEVINEPYSNLLEGIDPSAEKLQKDQEIIVTCAKGRSSEMVGWLRRRRGIFLASAYHAGCVENPNPNDHCFFTSDYVYFIYWFNYWENLNRAS
jgi:rhodanese-related sulfurtransferase